LAVVIVGGMLIGPIMLLLVVPSLQLLVMGKDKDGESGGGKPDGAATKPV
jgi:cobalt-zinc-cadmium resistance protein CzcA